MQRASGEVTWISIPNAVVLPRVLTGLCPPACLVSYGFAGVDPVFVGIGPVTATRTALGRAGLGVKDIDTVEPNEALAAQACVETGVLGPPKVHPNGATDAINTVRPVNGMRRSSNRYGLVTLCIGSAQGIAAILEAV